MSFDMQKMFDKKSHYNKKKGQFILYFPDTRTAKLIGVISGVKPSGKSITIGKAQIKDMEQLIALLEFIPNIK
jgi:hypothetical protein